MFSVDKGFIHKEPGIQVINSVGKLRKDRSFPIFIANNENRIANNKNRTIRIIQTCNRR